MLSLGPPVPPPLLPPALTPRSPTPPCKQVSVALLPRYPLFGGWSTTFLFAWSMPLEGVVRKDASTGTYTLATLFGPSVANLVVDDLTVKVCVCCCYCYCGGGGGSGLRGQPVDGEGLGRKGVLSSSEGEAAHSHCESVGG